MNEKYNYREWFQLQVDKAWKIREDSCLLRSSNSFEPFGLSEYDGDDTYGYCIDYVFETVKISRRKRSKYCRFTILVCQEGVKLLSFKIDKELNLVEMMQKMIDIVTAIKDSLDEFKAH